MVFLVQCLFYFMIQESLLINQGMFKVEGEGFMIDSTRLTMKYSEFLYNMLHNDLDIGVSQEGSVNSTTACSLFDPCHS